MSTASSLNRLDWITTLRVLDVEGYAILPGFLSEAQCLELAAVGEGEVLSIETLNSPGPGFCQGSISQLTRAAAPVVQLGNQLYPPLSLLANVWSERYGSSYRFPPSVQGLVDECADWGQHRALSYLSCYDVGDYERLHHCVKGEQRVFPVQAIALLSKPGRDFSGGELRVTRQDDAAPTSTFHIHAQQGDVVLLTVKQKPRCEAGEVLWSTLRHGVEPVRSGQRMALNLVFHRGNGADEVIPSPALYASSNAMWPATSAVCRQPNSNHTLRILK